MDPATLCRLAASCEEARQIDATHYEGIIRTRVAIVTLRAHGRGEILEADPPHSLLIAVEGHSTGLPGTYHGRAALNLMDGSPATTGEYRLELDILGRLGALGHPFFQATTQRLANSFAAKVEAYLRGS